jgi:hypothetical protein
MTIKYNATAIMSVEVVVAYFEIYYPAIRFEGSMA